MPWLAPSCISFLANNLLFTWLRRGVFSDRQWLTPLWGWCCFMYKENLARDKHNLPKTAQLGVGGRIWSQHPIDSGLNRSGFAWRLCLQWLCAIRGSVFSPSLSLLVAGRPLQPQPMHPLSSGLEEGVSQASTHRQWGFKEKTPRSFHPIHPCLSGQDWNHLASLTSLAETVPEKKPLKRLMVGSCQRLPPFFPVSFWRNLQHSPFGSGTTVSSLPGLSCLPTRPPQSSVPQHAGALCSPRSLLPL